jgi:hypothetical protein
MSARKRKSVYRFLEEKVEQLRDSIIHSFNAKVKDGSLQKVIDKNIDDFVRESVGSVFSRYGSDFGKAFEKALQEDLCSKVGKISLEQYNDIVIRNIKERMDSVYLKSADEHMQKLLDKMFKKAKGEYKFSELVEEFLPEDEDCECDPGGKKISLHIEEYERSGLAFVYMDVEPKKESYSCEYRLVLNFDKEDEETAFLSSSVRKDHRGTRQVRPEGLEGLNGFDATLFQIWAQGSKIECDFDEAKSLIRKNDY